MPPISFSHTARTVRPRAIAITEDGAVAIEQSYRVSFGGMVMTRTVGALTLLNLGLLTMQLARSADPEVAPVLRARAIELVDEQGRVRSELKVLPAGTANGVTYQETVIFRLVTADGKPRVKLTTSTEGSGLLLLGASDESYTRLGTRGAEPKVELIDRDRVKTLTP
jgi:hypothetical protein